MGRYWQLDDFRGGSNCATDVAAVSTVLAAQLAIATRHLMVASPGALGRLAPNPLIRVIELSGATPTVIAVARKRRDNRLSVRRFIDTARTAAERGIHLLPEGASVLTAGSRRRAAQPSRRAATGLSSSGAAAT